MNNFTKKTDKEKQPTQKTNHHPSCPRCTGKYKAIGSLKVKYTICPKCEGGVFYE